MTKAAHIAGFGNDRQGIDRANARHLAQPLIIGAGRQHGGGHLLDGVALPDQVTGFSQHHPEHCHRGSIEWDGKAKDVVAVW